MRDHEPLTITSFLGTYDRGEDDSVPQGFFQDSRNIRFLKKGVATRYGSSSALTVSSIKRIVVYKRIGEAQRLLILDGSGRIYDSTNLSTPILTIALMTDFSSVTIFDRAYITPHDGSTGLAGQKVYVYEGSGTARAAAGLPPSSFTLLLANGGGGKLEAGTRVFAVCYQTSSGYITAPGGFIQSTTVAAATTTISAIPTGPGGTAARVLLATKIINGFNGDFNARTYYFVPSGTINDNVTTTFLANYFDSELLDDATYLLEQLDEIPAGVGIGLVQGRMIVWGENANSAVVRVSKAGEPESHNSVEGFVTVNPGDSGGGLKNYLEYMSLVVMFKSLRSYTIQPSDTLPPANWKVLELDDSVGTECHGIGKVLDFGQNVQNTVFVADRAGLRLFVGTFNDDNILTFSIDSIWGRITDAAFNTVEVAIDSINFLIYIAVPLDGATTPNAVLVGDYTEGLSAAAIQWTTWTFPAAPTSIVVDVESSVPVFKFGSVAGNVYKYNPALLLDSGAAIDSWVEFPLLPSGDVDDTINNYTGIRIRVRGSGSLQITGGGIDGANPFTAQSLTLSATRAALFRGFNFNGEGCAVKLRMNSANEWFALTKFILYLSVLWDERPQ